MLGGAVVDEGIVGEAAIVCMIVFNFDEVVGSELFECKLGLDGFITSLEVFIIMWM